MHTTFQHKHNLLVSNKGRGKAYVSVLVFLLPDCMTLANFLSPLSLNCLTIFKVGVMIAFIL